MKFLAIGLVDQDNEIIIPDQSINDWFIVMGRVDDYSQNSIGFNFRALWQHPEEFKSEEELWSNTHPFWIRPDKVTYVQEFEYDFEED